MSVLTGNNIVNINIGQVHACKQGPILKTLLGSCVSACLFDPIAKVAGMNHILLASKADMKKFDINAQDHKGWTALHYAIRKKNEEVIKTLLENGANPNIKTTLTIRGFTKGLTALGMNNIMSGRNSRRNIKKLLEKYGAKK